MDFTPKGCLPLTTAVDQLAEARRPVGQTNDDARNAARVELRAELHSRSISAVVLCPSTGNLFYILPNNWALEKALPWFEQGECLLTNDDGKLVEASFRMFHTPERAKIFVIQDEFQRLVAKQEIKQEAVPPDDPLPTPKLVLKAEADDAVVRKKMKPKAWLTKARKDQPQRSDEEMSDYADRLHPLMETNATKVWPVKTLLRRLYEAAQQIDRLRKKRTRHRALFTSCCGFMRAQNCATAL